MASSPQTDFPRGFRKLKGPASSPLPTLTESPSKGYHPDNLLPNIRNTASKRTPPWFPPPQPPTSDSVPAPRNACASIASSARSKPLPNTTRFIDLEDLLVEIHGREVELMNPHDIKGNPHLLCLLGEKKEILYA